MSITTAGPQTKIAAGWRGWVVVTLAWVTLVTAIIGGFATRGWGIGNLIAHWAVFGDPKNWWFIAWGIWGALVLAWLIDVADGVPDAIALIGALTLPSVLEPTKNDGWVGGFVNWIPEHVNLWLGSHMDFLFGHGNGIAAVHALAAIMWTFTVVTGVLVAWQRIRHGAGKGARGGAARGARAPYAATARS